MGRPLACGGGGGAAGSRVRATGVSWADGSRGGRSDRARAPPLWVGRDEAPRRVAAPTPGSVVAVEEYGQCDSRAARAAAPPAADAPVAAPGWGPARHDGPQSDLAGGL